MLHPLVCIWTNRLVTVMTATAKIAAAKAAAEIVTTTKIGTTVMVATTVNAVMMVVGAVMLSVFCSLHKVTTAHLVIHRPWAIASSIAIRQRSNGDTEYNDHQNYKDSCYHISVLCGFVFDCPTYL